MRKRGAVDMIGLASEHVPRIATERRKMGFIVSSQSPDREQVPGRTLILEVHRAPPHRLCPLK